MISEINSRKQKFPDIDVELYLKRIGCAPEPRPTLKFLRKLHRNHLLHIPFENLDIHTGSQIILDVHKIYEKIIPTRRGGFCYELNSLFAHLLGNLGFDVKLISARVISSTGKIPPEFDHLVLIVHLNGKDYLADVGMGRSIMSPKEITLDLVQMDYNSYYKITQSVKNEDLYLWRSKDGIQFEEEYIFSTQERKFVEFIGMCQFHQTSSDSKFTQKKLITQAKADGRITLTDHEFIVTKLGQQEKFPILNNDEFKSKLWQHFGITMTRNY